MANQDTLGQAELRRRNELSSFVGRVRELADLAGLLDTARLVTITGPGGSGKTRIAFELVDRIRERHPGGVVIVDLAPLRDPGLIASAIAAALVLPNDPGRELFARIVTRLAETDTVLVLDNCEQLLPAGATTASALLAHCARLHILATSRTPLRLRGEREYPLDPLPVPGEDDAMSLAALARNEAVELLVDRARAVDPHLRLTPENAPVIAAICRRLDGLPLAIELAAARVRVLPIHALLRRLDQALPVLIAGPLDAPARQRSLRDTVTWSYDLLRPVERRVFARLSVFVGGARLDTAGPVLGLGEPAGFEPLDILERLVRHALVRVAADPDGEPRFTMLMTIRELAAERLEEHGEVAAARRLHARVYLALAEKAALDRMPLDTHAWYMRFDREWDNLRAATDWLFEQGDGRELQLVGLLYRFWASRGHDDEARSWIEAALERCEGAPPADVAGVLRAAAMSAYDQARYEAAIDYAERAYDISGGLGDHVGAAVTLLGLARIATAAGLRDRARSAYAEAIGLADEFERPALRAAAMANLGVLEMHAGRYVEAVEVSRGSLAIARRHETFDWIAVAAETLSGAQVAIGDYEGALASVRECLGAIRAFGAKGGRLGFLLYVLAAVAAGIGEARVGARLLPVGDRLLQTLGDAPEPFSGDLRASTERRLRAQLGSDFDPIFESGRSLSVDEAIEAGLSLVVPARRSSAGSGPVRAGRSRHDLTPREHEVLALVAEGRTDGEIAAALFISRKTASVHVANIKSKLGARSRVEIAMMAGRFGRGGG